MRFPPPSLKAVSVSASVLAIAPALTLVAVCSIILLEKARGKGRRKNKSRVRIWVDGVFDITHFGHMNAFRQARELGTCLIVGINDDESIKKCKGPSVMSESERMECVEACRFVDEVVPGIPYIMDQSYISYIIKEYDIDYVVHGDDPCIVDGKDVYETAKAAGKFRTVPRTEGVSTTDVIGRILGCRELFPLNPGDTEGTEGIDKIACILPSTCSFLNGFLRYLPTPKQKRKVVYVPGIFDMLLINEVRVLKYAASLGDWVLVGVLNDHSATYVCRGRQPILNTEERMIGVLGCKYVDDLWMDCPLYLTEQMISSLGISLVLNAFNALSGDATEGYTVPSNLFEIAKERGIYREISKDDIIDHQFSIRERLLESRAYFEERFCRKRASEEKYYRERKKSGEEDSDPVDVTGIEIEPEYSPLHEGISVKIRFFLEEDLNDVSWEIKFVVDSAYNRNVIVVGKTESIDYEEGRNSFVYAVDHISTEGLKTSALSNTGILSAVLFHEKKEILRVNFVVQVHNEEGKLFKEIFNPLDT